MEKLDSHNYLKLSEIIDATEYERLHGIKEGFINHEKNEDNLYGVYVPREQKAGEKGEFIAPTSGTIEFELLPDVVCINLSDLSPLRGVDIFGNDITILDGGELRKGNIKELAGKPINQKYKGLKLLRLSVGAIDIVESTDSKGETNIHIPTVHRGRTGFPHAWDMRTTTAGGALRSDLATESLREAVEESGVLGINKDGEFELCLPATEGVNRGAIRHWMDYAIDTFLSTGGKFDRFIGKGGSEKWNEREIEASEYAKKVFGRNFHGSTERFSPGVLKTILLAIKEGKRYSYRISRNMNRADELIQDLGSENFREVTVHEGDISHTGVYWIDNDPAAFHVFRIQTDIAYPDGFQPIFRFYSESGVHYQRNPRIENLTGKIDTTGLENGNSIDMKPVPFLQKFARQVIEGRTRRLAEQAISK